MEPEPIWEVYTKLLKSTSKQALGVIENSKKSFPATALVNELALAPVTLYRLLADDALRPLPRLIPVELRPVAST